MCKRILSVKGKHAKLPSSVIPECLIVSVEKTSQNLVLRVSSRVPNTSKRYNLGDWSPEKDYFQAFLSV